MNEDTPGAPGLEILDKADALLRVLERAGEASAVDIANATGEPTSSTYRLLTNLQLLGWVESTSRRGLYRLGIDFLRVGSIVEDRLDVREAAVPELKRLLADTGATSFLCIRARERAVCVERFEGSDVRSLALTLGQSLVLHHGAAPRAIFAFLPRGERDALIEEFAASTSPATPTRAQLEDLVTTIRAAGYALSDGDVTPGIAAVGAPIFNHRGDVEAALSISGLREKLLDPATDAIGRVRAAARRASAALGYQKETDDDGR